MLFQLSRHLPVWLLIWLSSLSIDFINAFSVPSSSHPRSHKNDDHPQKRRMITKSNFVSTSNPSGRARQDGRWMTRYQELMTYKELQGHTNVPKRDDSGLGLWVYTQRRQYRLMSSGEKSNMTQQRISLLRDIGFDFELASKINHPKYVVSWDERFQELLKFKEKYGHTNVTRSSSVDEPLYRWVAKQRYFYKSYSAGLQQSTLDEEKVNRLQGIGFEFRKRTRKNKHLKVLVEDREAIRKRYYSNFEQIQLFYKKNGHINLPQTKTYYVLNEWLKEIRRTRGMQLVDNSMRKQLDEMSFDWTGKKVFNNPDEVVVRLKWVDRYRELQQFKRDNSHCNVPQNYTINPGLAKWVKVQRDEYHQMLAGVPSKMTDKRLEALEFIGFDFYIGYDLGDGEDYNPLFNKSI